MTSSDYVPPLDPFQVAFLAAGAPRACETAIVSLAARGLLRAEAGNSNWFGRFYAQGTPTSGAHPLELAVHATAERPNAPAFFEAAHERTVRGYRARGEAGKLNQRQQALGRRLQEDGPGMPRRQGASLANLRHAARPPLAVVRRELQALSLVRPAWPPGRLTAARRTAAGQRALAELRGRHRSLKDGQGAEAEPVLAAAIWGVEVLSGTRLGYLCLAFRPSTTTIGDG